MNDLVVHRRAQDAGITAISLERRLARPAGNFFLGQLLEVHRREARRGAFSRALLRFAGESPLFPSAALSGPAIALRAQSRAPAALLLPRSSKRPRHANGPAAGNTPPAVRFAFRTLATAARQFLPDRPAAVPTRRHRYRNVLPPWAGARKYCKSRLPPC